VVDSAVVQLRGKGDAGRIQPVRTVHDAKSRFKYVMVTWWGELLCCGLVVGSLIGLAITLAIHQERPVPEWPYSLTMNSVISLFTLVFKTSALFVLCQGISQLKWSWFSKTKRPLGDVVTYDDASRGAFGAAKLMWILRHRHLTASLLASVIILMQLLDPLAQQLVQHDTCSNMQLLSDAQATFPRTQSFSKYGRQYSTYIAHPLTVTVAPGAIVALQTAAFSSNAGLFNFSCPTGRCTSDDSFGSLGWCSSCEDVSDELVYSERVDKSQSPAQWTEVTLPSGASANSRHGNQTARTLTAQGRNTSTGATEFVYLKVSTNSTTYSNGSDGIHTWRDRGYGAARCESHMCAREYNATVTNNTLEELELSNIRMEPAVDGSFTVVRLGCLTDEQRIKLAAQGYNISGGTRWLKYNSSLVDAYGTAVAQPSDGPVPTQCMYEIHWPVWSATAQTMYTLFAGQVDPEPAAGTHVNPDDLMTKIFNNGDVEFETIATSYRSATTALEYYIRQNGDDNTSAPAIGFVYSSSTCLRVQWPWITVPAALTLLLLLSFVAMIVETTTSGSHGSAFAGQQLVHDFKASPLALLFHGLEPQGHESSAQVSCDEVYDTKAMEKTAEGIYVQFTPSDMGWHFVGDNEPL
jgi:hypothetical protein